MLIENTFVIISIACWILCEAVFAIYIIYYLAPTLQSKKTPLYYHSDMNPRKLLTRVLDMMDTLKVYDATRFVSGFFCGADINHLKDGNVKSFLAWAMYSSKYDHLSPSELVELHHMLEVCSQRLNLTSPSGYNEDIRHVRMTIDDIQFLHRPLLIYVCSYAMERVFEWLVLRWYFGFQYQQYDGQSYWIREHKRHSTTHNNDQLNAGNSNSSKGEDVPVVILHGITPGWSVYFHTIQALSQQRTCLLIDVNAIKIMSLHTSLVVPYLFAERVKTIVRQRLGYQKCSFVGHSFGSITAGWIVKYHPEIVSHITLIDPVSLLLALPDVAYNFIYRQPQSLIQAIIYYGAAREITIANTLHRHFCWQANALWLEDIPHDIGVVVAVSKKDPILHGKGVLEYANICQEQRESIRIRYQQLLSDQQDEIKAPAISNIHVVCWPKFTHAQYLSSATANHELNTAIRRNEACCEGSIHYQ